MTNDVPSPTGHPFPPDDTRLNAAEGASALDDDVTAGLDDDADATDRAHAERLSKLPPEERDADRTVGAGVMDEGGTAISRGTGTLGGEAQDRDVEADDANRRDLEGDEVAFPTEPGGGTR